jgi:2-polyprenyl-3-methyl-5-hydroxy-6-metoxy-1,4-benzoquinol methylase
MTQTSQTPKYLTTEAYWSSMWRRSSSLAAQLWRYDPAVADLASLINSVIAKLLTTRPKLRVLEVGCANSLWLPYLAQDDRISVYGLDYSRVGCSQAKQQLYDHGVTGDIICCDFFEFADNCPPFFDLIISFGFIEHFSEPNTAIQRMKHMLTPNGAVLATVPNIKGIYGTIQECIGKNILEEHIAMDNQELAHHFTKSNLHEISSGYVGGALYLSVVNYHAVTNHLLRATYPATSCIAKGIDMSAGILLQKCHISINNHLTSPYVYAFGYNTDAK